MNDRLKLGLNIAPTLQLAKNQTIDGQRNLLSAATLASPLLSPYDANGDYVLALNAPNMFPQPNWRRVLDEKIDQRKTITVLSNMFAELDIWNGIKYKFQAGVDRIIYVTLLHPLQEALLILPPLRRQRLILIRASIITGRLKTC